MEPNILTRLKKVAGKQTTTLTHYGRKTGQPHEVTIWFVLDGERFYIGIANVNRQWVRNIQKTPRVRLSISGETFDEGEITNKGTSAVTIASLTASDEFTRWAAARPRVAELWRRGPSAPSR
jgi:deazaflavin-dependent oxidoreductase (nitroreductase family)